MISKLSDFADLYLASTPARTLSPTPERLVSLVGTVETQDIKGGWVGECHKGLLGGSGVGNSELRV